MPSLVSSNASTRAASSSGAVSTVRQNAASGEPTAWRSRPLQSRAVTSTSSPPATVADVVERGEHCVLVLVVPGAGHEHSCLVVRLPDRAVADPFGALVDPRDPVARAGRVVGPVPRLDDPGRGPGTRQDHARQEHRPPGHPRRTLRPLHHRRRPPARPQRRGDRPRPRTTPPPLHPAFAGRDRRRTGRRTVLLFRPARQRGLFPFFRICRALARVHILNAPFPAAPASSPEPGRLSSVASLTTPGHCPRAERRFWTGELDVEDVAPRSADRPAFSSGAPARTLPFLPDLRSAGTGPYT